MPRPSTNRADIPDRLGVNHLCARSFGPHGRGGVPMTELVTAVFGAASVAEAAIHDLEAARIPSAVIQREFGVTVAVDEKHADAVTGILKQRGPVDIEEHTAQSHHR